MKLENQVCSLELSKKLKELGVKQESLFYWQYNLVEREFIIVPKSLTKVDYENIKDTDYPVFSAFTVAELGEMLPNKFYTHKVWCKNECLWVCENTDFPRVTETADTEANARAKCLIYLIEQGII